MDDALFSSPVLKKRKLDDEKQQIIKHAVPKTLIVTAAVVEEKDVKMVEKKENTNISSLTLAQMKQILKENKIVYQLGKENDRTYFWRLLKQKFPVLYFCVLRNKDFLNLK